MFRNPLLVILILPAMEIALLAMFASRFGLGMVAVEVFGTSLLGMYHLRRSGYRKLLEVSTRLQTAEESPEALLSSVMQGIAGLMLIIPGIATDLVGLYLSIPACRRVLARKWAVSGRVYSYGAAWQQTQRPVNDATFETTSSDEPSAHQPAAGQVIEGEFKREE